ncbi:LuxR family transcriptional regulator [Kitasatospora sp. NPDC088391]|uniref:LuxR family transcriptional regulator n=1 Tax=Kitasatospora sp. NPDC088391 TaxID=3364074 RepID=UPI00381CC26C
MSDLLPEEDRALYREVLAQGGRVTLGEAMARNPEATRRLVDLGLLVHHDWDRSLTAVNPRAVAARLGADLCDAAVRRLVESRQVPARMADLAQAYDTARLRPDPGRGVERVTDRQQIRHRILQIESEMRHETLAAQPGGARPTDQMRQSRDRTVEFLARGIALRTLYQPGALTHRPTAEYAAVVSAAGERVRVLDEPFRRMLIFDRRIAVVSASADDEHAVFVEDPAVLAALLDVFERDWARAERPDWHALAGTPRETGVPAELGPLLAAGLTHRAIASRLGLSERTVAGHIARLREFYDAETLFQLGWQLRGAREGRAEPPDGTAPGAADG